MRNLHKTQIIAKLCYNICKQLKDEKLSTEVKLLEQKVRDREFDHITQVIEDLDFTSINTFPLIYNMRKEDRQ